jgi:hypothetical protein
LKQKDFVRWIRQIFQTEDAEIDCARLQDLLPIIVDAEVSGIIMNGEDRQLRLHLSHCPDCNDVYETVRRLASLTDNDRLPEAGELLAAFNLKPVPKPVPEETADPTFAGVALHR